MSLFYIPGMHKSAKEIIIQSKPITDQDTQVSVSGRQVGNGESPFVEPLLDTANRYKKIILVRQKVEIIVYRHELTEESRIVIRPLRFNLFVMGSSIG